MHGQNINLPECICPCVRVCVCVCLSVCLCVRPHHMVRHTFCQLAYRSDPSTDFTVDSLTDADLRKDVPFGVSLMNNHI